MIWTEQSVAELERLAASGISARQVSEELGKLGFNFSRSAVLGKLKRLGVNMATATGPRPEPEHDSEGLDVFSLKSKSCRWPVSGEGYLTRFCGRRKASGSYCELHAKMAYRKWEER